MLKSIRDIRHSLFYRFIMQQDASLLALGDASTGCQWTFCPIGLSSSSIVYCGGVGRDVTFDHAIADRFHCQIWLFDPSPTGKETMSLEVNRRPEFCFVPVGISARDEILRLAPPTNPKEGSWFASSSSMGGLVSVECHSLYTLMQRHGHDHIDLLKIDIEGPEYEVIDDMLDHKLDVRQICVEYHHGILPGFTRMQTIKSILRLLSNGYCLIHKVGNNHTFIKKTLL
jgi:FkbM family methyltransferase